MPEFGIPVERAYTLAGAVVTAIGEHYDGLPLALPERRLVVPGLPAYDCPMLAVHVERIYPHDGRLVTEASPQLEGEAAFYMRAMTIAVYLLRCVPTLQADGSPPHADVEEAAAADVLRDAVVVQNALVAALDEGDLPGCAGLAWEGWETITPEGALGGGVIRFRLGME